VESLSSRSRVSGPIVKFPRDENEYRGIILSNRLQVLLVRNFSAKKAAVSLSIGVGPINDPKYYSGLSQLLLYSLVSRDTENLEIEYGLAGFLERNGGSAISLAYNDDTSSITFEVNATALNGALERYQYQHRFFKM